MVQNFGFITKIQKIITNGTKQGKNSVMLVYKYGLKTKEKG
jgi:hypothetical protein